jgi:rfaE bifunctional protein kinase chain/domain
MKLARLKALTREYPRLRLAVAGDFCLDRYLEIDPLKKETSLETGLPVYNVVRVRSQPGGAGTILNNLAALQLGRLYPVGFAGSDGEGLELSRALRRLPGVKMDGFVSTKLRRTFTYCKPLLMERERPPVELNRLDSKNWTPTPASVEDRIIRTLRTLAPQLDGLILLDQVDTPETGVITSRVLEAVADLARKRQKGVILADSRRGLRGFPPVCFKMNVAELASWAGFAGQKKMAMKEIQSLASALAAKQMRPVFVTLAEAGMVGAEADGKVTRMPALPVRGPIDIVGAGDAVTANVAASLAAGASVVEAMEMASLAASIVIHQLGTTGTAALNEIEALFKQIQR